MHKCDLFNMIKVITLLFLALLHSALCAIYATAQCIIISSRYAYQVHYFDQKSYLHGLSETNVDVKSKDKTSLIKCTG